MSENFLDRVSSKALGQLLVDKGALTQEQLEEALDLGRRDNLRLGAALMQLNYISQDALGYALGEQYGVQPMELHPSMADAALLARFPYELLDRHTMLPLIELGGDLVVVVGDPNDQTGLRELQRLVPNLRISAQLGSAEQIRRCLEQTRGVMARSRASSSDSGAGRSLPYFSETPTPESPEFAEWLAQKAVSNFGRDVVVRLVDGDLHVGLLPGSGVAGGAGLTELARIPGSRLGQVRDSILRKMERIAHANGQVAAWHEVILHEGRSYRLLALMPGFPAEPMVRLRALQMDSQFSSVACSPPFIPELSAGRCTACVYASDLDLDVCLGDFFLENVGSQVFVLIQGATRTVYGNVTAYPAPFGDVAAIAEATGATCVIFDHPVPRHVVDRLLAAVSPPPAVAVCIPISGGGDATSNPWLNEYSDNDDAEIRPTGARAPRTTMEENL